MASATSSSRRTASSGQGGSDELRSAGGEEQEGVTHQTDPDRLVGNAARPGSRPPVAATGEQRGASGDGQHAEAADRGERTEGVVRERHRAPPLGEHEPRQHRSGDGDERHPSAAPFEEETEVEQREQEGETREVSFGGPAAGEEKEQQEAREEQQSRLAS